MIVKKALFLFYIWINLLLFTNCYSQSVNNAPYIVDFASPASNPTNQKLVPIYLTLSKPVSGFEQSDIIVKNGTVASFTWKESPYVATIGPNYNTDQFLFDRPSDVAIDANGNIYVVDMWNHRIQIFDKDIKYIATMGNGAGYGVNQLRHPSSILIDTIGNIYVTEAGAHRIKIFDKERKLIATVGSGGFGSENNQFHAPSGIAVDKVGNMYVADQNNHRVQIFDKNKNYLASIGTGSIGSSNEHFHFPSKVTLDTKDNLYVVDSYNHRIQIFDKNLIHVGTIGTGQPGSNNDQLHLPSNIKIDNGNIYICDSWNHRIQIFDENLEYINTIDSTDLATNRPVNPKTINFDGYGNIYLVDNGNDILVFDPNWKYISSFGESSSGFGDYSFLYPSSVTSDSQGNIYVTDKGNHRIQIYDWNRTYVESIGTGKKGFSNNELHWPSDVLISSEGNIFIADEYNHRIQVFDQARNYIKTITGSGIGINYDEFPAPSAMAFDLQDNLYLVESWQQRIEVYDQNGNHLATMGTGERGAGNDEFNQPSDVAIDSVGNIYVTDERNDRIQIFDVDRRYLTTIGAGNIRSSYDYFTSPKGIALDIYGNIYIVDSGNNRIKIFDENYNYLGSIGGLLGIGDNQLKSPSDVNIDAHGRIFIVDEWNHRIQIFDPPKEYQFSVIPNGDGLITIDIPSNIANDTSGIGNEAATFSITYDGTAPEVVISSTESDTTTAKEIPFNFTFSEKVKGFDISDVKIVNGEIKDISTNDSTTFKATITAINEEEVILAVGSNSAIDLAGNGNIVADTFAIFYNELIVEEPEDSLSLEIEIVQLAPSDSTFSVTLTFNHKVKDFGISDILITNGTIVALYTEDSILYTATLFPMEEGEISVTVKEEIVNVVPETIFYQKPQVTGVIESLSFDQVNIFPVPSSDQIIVELNLDKPAEIQIIVNTISGGKIYYNNIGKVSTVKKQIDLSQYMTGTYIVIVQVDNEQILKRIILE